MKQCCTCQQSFPLDSFNFRNVARGERSSSCRACQAIHRRKHYLSRRQHYIDQSGVYRDKRNEGIREFILSIKAKTPCADCGQIFHHYAMDFDHLPQYEKSFEISNALNVSRERLVAELAKCELVCANCHRVRTWAQQGNQAKFRKAARQNPTDPKCAL